MSLKVLCNSDKGLLFIVSAPAGTGKTTLVNRLQKEFPCVIQSLSFTTRPKRTDETDGVDYRFITKQEFEERIERGEFLEYATLYGEYYGTSRVWVEEHLQQGKHVVLVIDTQGALKLMGTLPLATVFILPPSIEELRARLMNRKTESSEVIEKRLSWAEGEIQQSCHYDYVIINDNIDIAYDVLRSIFIAEEHRQKRLTSENVIPKKS